MELELCKQAPSSWTRLRITDVSYRFTSGGTPSRKQPEYFDGGAIPWVKTQELCDWILTESDEHITEEGLANSSAKWLPPETILLAMYGATVGQLGILGRRMTCNQACAAIVVNPEVVDYRFLFYQLMAAREQIKSLSTGAAQQNLSGTVIKEFVLPFPPLSQQNLIADVLWSLDRRVDLLREENAALEAIADAIYTSWFVDFEPVHANIRSLADSGDENVPYPLFPSTFDAAVQTVIPAGWSVGSVGDVCSIFDSKRVPLSSTERAVRKGQFPYYGAAALMDYVDSFIFDGVYLLLGEDGSVLNSDGTPVHQYVWGQFWVNNHAHVLQGKNSVCTEHLMLALRKTNISPFVTGAVQAKLNQGNLTHIPFLRPSIAVAEDFCLKVTPLFSRLRRNFDAIKTLKEMRDALLPELISGRRQLEISDVAKGAAPL